MNDDEKIEEKIKAKGLIAPRLTPELVRSKIHSATYAILPSGKSMVCEITLENGFTVRGDSSCVSIANFDEELGKEISFNDAQGKIWELEAYLLQQRIYEENKANG